MTCEAFLGAPEFLAPCDINDPFAAMAAFMWRHGSTNEAIHQVYEDFEGMTRAEREAWGRGILAGVRQEQKP